MKPFKQDTQRFMVHNYVFDVIMPSISPNGFKVLMCAIRQTMGWADDSSPTGRKISDVISYSQFTERTGISSRSTVSRAINECLEADYLIRRQVGRHQGTGAPVYAYALNAEYEVPAGTEIGPASPETVPAEQEKPVTSPKTVPAASTEIGPASPEIGPAASPKTVLTKERKEKEKKEKGNKDDLSFSSLILKKHLRLQMPETTYNVGIQPLSFERENGRLTVRAPAAPLGRQALEIAEHQWAPAIARSVEELFGGAVQELVFEEQG